MIKIVAMIIMVGGGHGGPTTIQGFQSLASCQAAIPAVVQQISNAQSWVTVRPWAVCVEATP